LLGLTYVSKAKISFDDVLLEKLASKSAKENKLYKITGYLYLSNIKNDYRNRVLNVLIDDKIRIRKFPSWNMKWLNKNMLIQINMEFVLTDYLVFSAKTKNTTLNEKTVWRMIDKLSAIRRKL